MTNQYYTILVSENGVVGTPGVYPIQPVTYQKASAIVRKAISEGRAERGYWYPVNEEG